MLGEYQNLFKDEVFLLELVETLECGEYNGTNAQDLCRSREIVASPETTTLAKK